MNMRIAAAAVALIVTNVTPSQQTAYPRAKVSFEDFKVLVDEVEEHRASRLIDLDTFLAMSREPGTIVLDTRSAHRYRRIHVEGAKHLSFTDFTQASLGAVIPSLETRVLIYCNNNFDGDPVDFASKVALPLAAASGTSASPARLPARAQPLTMALNIPTYLNLYGYGYRNVYELDELVDVADPRLGFEGTAVDRRAPRPDRR